MDLDAVLNRTTSRVVDTTRSTARSVRDLGSATGVEATGAATRTIDQAQSRGAAVSAAILALAALGGIVVMRFIFSGAVS